MLLCVLNRYRRVEKTTWIVCQESKADGMISISGCLLFLIVL